ncbi:hypothetical protein ACWGJP_10625 [Microbacterium sp. NPDC055903]
MPRPSITSHAVGDAIARYRELRQLTRDELTYALSVVGHDLDVDDLRPMEQGRAIVTVDDLVAIAVVLDVPPFVLLTHGPAGLLAEESLGTGVPAGVDQLELVAWAQGRTGLERPARLSWAQDRLERLRILAAHHQEHVEAALAEQDELGEPFMAQEADAVPVQRLLERIQQGEHTLREADRALAYAEHRLDALQGAGGGSPKEVAP